LACFPPHWARARSRIEAVLPLWNGWATTTTASVAAARRPATTTSVLTTYGPYLSGVDAARSRDSAGVPDDLPEMAVGVAEVAGIDPPGPVVRRRDARARGRGSRKNLVDLGAAPNELAEAELPALSAADGKLCVLREVAASVEAEEQAALELEQRGRTAR